MEVSWCQLGHDWLNVGIQIRQKKKINQGRAIKLSLGEEELRSFQELPKVSNLVLKFLICRVREAPGKVRLFQIGTVPSQVCYILTGFPQQRISLSWLFLSMFLFSIVAIASILAAAAAAPSLQLLSP